MHQCFGWYLIGPYSPTLARDYYALDRALSVGDAENDEQSLSESAKGKLCRAREFMQKPQELGIEDHQWWEILSSVHFLTRISRLREEEAFERLEKQKPDIAQHAKAALERLAAFELAV